MRFVFWAGFWVFLADQATKWIVVHWLGLAQRLYMDVLPPLLNFRMAWNTGVNFGLFAGMDMRWVLVAVALLISAVVLYWVWRDRPGKWTQISAGVLIGGALGNVVDRILYGAVADFLNMSWWGFENPYSFNIADIAIFVGALGLVLLGDSGKGKPRAKKA